MISKEATQQYTVKARRPSRSFQRLEHLRTVFFQVVVNCPPEAGESVQKPPPALNSPGEERARCMGFARAQKLRTPKNHNTTISVRGTPSNHKIIGMASSSSRAVFVRTFGKHGEYTFMVIH